MRLMRHALYASAVAATITVSAQAETDQVSFFNWSDYIDPETVVDFLITTGTTVQLDTYGEADEAEARLLAGGTGYDLAVLPSETVGRMIDAGAIRPFDHDSIPNLSGLDTELLQLYLEALPETAEYVIPYLWGTTGLAYDHAAVLQRIPDAPLDSWALLFDPENARRLADCGISIVDSVEEVVPAALAYLGLDPQSQSEQDLDAAFAALTAIFPYVRSFDAAQYDRLMNGEVCLSLAWSTDGIAPSLEDDSDRYVYMMPREGTNLWVDLFVLPSDAPRPEAAHQLVNHLLRPESMAASTMFTFATNSVPASSAEIDDPAYNIPALTLPADLRDRLFIVPRRDGAAKRALDRRWRMLQIGM